MVAREYPVGTVFEFDTSDELRANSIRVSWKTSIPRRSTISLQRPGATKTIFATCIRWKQGLTNLSCHIRVGDLNTCIAIPASGRWHHRSPSRGGGSRAWRAIWGFDRTFITEDPEKVGSCRLYPRLPPARSA